MASKSDYLELFEKIAKAVLNHTVLEVRPSGSSPFQNDVERHFRIAEIEFYWNDYGEHKDTFTHCSDVQKTTGNWYFNKIGPTYKAGSYKGGTWKGVDVSIGKGEDVAAGSFLLRSLIPCKLTPLSTVDRMEFTADYRNKRQLI